MTPRLKYTVQKDPVATDLFTFSKGVPGDIFLTSLVLTLIRLDTLFWCLNCWLRTSKYGLENVFFFCKLR